VHPADDDQSVDDLRQAFFPRTAALEARGDGVFSQWHARIGQCLRHQSFEQGIGQHCPHRDSGRSALA
jgi:hypothetical protein